MSNVMKAADDLKSLAARFRPFLEVAAVLEKIGSLEQAVRDAEIKKASAQKEAEKVEAQVSFAREELAKVKSEVSEVKATSNGILDNARADAGVIIKEAREEVLTIMRNAEEVKASSDANVSANRITINAQSQEIKRLEGQLAEIRNHIQEAKRRITGI